MSQSPDQKTGDRAISGVERGRELREKAHAMIQDAALMRAEAEELEETAESLLREARQLLRKYVGA